MFDKRDYILKNGALRIEYPQLIVQEKKNNGHTEKNIYCLYI